MKGNTRAVKSIDSRSGKGRVAAYDPKIVVAWFKEMDIDPPEAEYRFHPTRGWRFDLAWPEHRIALEIEGGVFTGGRHTRVSGFLGDMEKYNQAALLGWRVFRTIPTNLCMQETADMISLAISRKRLKIEIQEI